VLPKVGTPEYYEEIMYSIPEGIMVFDGALKLQSANRAAHELAMLSAEAMGKTAKESFFKGNQGLTGLISRTLSSGRPHTGFTTELIRPDATVVPVEASASPIEGPDGQTLGVALSLREASRLRELEEAIKKSERLAYLGTMAASVAHELRNPLGGIKGASQLLLEEIKGLPAEESLSEYLGVIVKQVDRLTGILESLRGLSRPGLPRTAPLNLHSVLDESLTLMAPEIKRLKLKVKREYDPSVPELEGDESSLQGVFLNLIKNAVESMSHGGVLTLGTGIPSDFLYSTIKTEKGKKTMLAVTISDSGSGIEPDALKDIFNPFYSTKGGGLGLGLALSLKVIEEHGGTIKVDSEPDKGTTFTVYLPMYR
jgi:two-component system, NtrC family, nitrogen regulation sensor histidine kinase GlnL